MTQIEITRIFAGLSATEQAKFLLAVSHNLTIAMRGFYVQGSDEVTNSKAMMGGNELQHHLSTEAGNKLSGQNGYPDETLIAILFEKAEYYGVFAELQSSLARAAKHLKSWPIQ